MIKTVTVCGISQTAPKTATRAIRMKCYDCSAGNYAEVERCLVDDCPLFAYRFGMRPATAQKRGRNIDVVDSGA